MKHLQAVDHLSHSDYDYGLQIDNGENAKQILIMSLDDYSPWLQKQSDKTKSWIDHHWPQPKTNMALPIPCFSNEKKAEEDGVFIILFLIDEEKTSLWDFAKLHQSLKPAHYRVKFYSNTIANQERFHHKSLGDLALAWALEHYRFDYFLSSKFQKNDDAKDMKKPRLLMDEDIINSTIKIAKPIYLARDLINMPADMAHPTALDGFLRTMSDDYGATHKSIIGEALLDQNFPLIYHVGKAASHPPRLVEIIWQGSQCDEKAKDITLIDKGVTFDTGGLDLKSASGMLYMKKDMGGAASAIATAMMVMAHDLPVKLRLLIPLVENAINEKAFRPLDILPSRSGLSISIGNTDAEGRLILADALTLACEDEAPDLLVDFATLTGAARVALGTELPSLFTHNIDAAWQICELSNEIEDSCWPMPIYEPYRTHIKGEMADLNNAPRTGYGDAIHAALFLDSFVKEGINWFHIDMMGWHLNVAPGRPQGGEPQMARTIFGYIQQLVV